MVRPIVSRISVRNVTLPVHLGSAVPERGEARELTGDRAVVAEPGHARLPRGVVVVGRVEVDALVDVLHVRDLVRHVGEVERLDPAEPDQPAGHPVGQDDEVPARVLAALERRLDRAEELVVVVDDLGVLHDRAVLGLEVLEGLVLRLVFFVGVDVQRPVGEVQLGRRRLRRRGLGRRRRARCRGGRTPGRSRARSCPFHSSRRLPGRR